jgi:MYXO-CTERM domain-containing protein
MNAGPLLVLLVLSVLAAPARAGAPVDLAISQALAEGTTVTAYIAVTDEAGVPVTGLQAGQLHATVGAQAAEVVSLVPFADSGEGVAYVFLVDVSRSLSAERFRQMQKALRDWIAGLGERDRAAVLGFGAGVRTQVEFTRDPAILNPAIDRLAPTDRQTFLHQALLRGMDLGRRQAEGLPPRRVLVMLSDGLDDAAGGVTEQEVLAEMADNPIPVYALGFSSVRDRTRREAGLKALGHFARSSGGLFVAAGQEDLAAAYAAMKQRIHAVYRIVVRCAGCVADGNRYHLQLSLISGGLTLSDGVDLRLYPGPAPAPAPAPAVEPTPTPAVEPAPVPVPAVEPTPTPAPASPVKPRVWWPYAVGGAGLLLALGLLLWRRRSHRPAVAADAAEPGPRAAADLAALADAREPPAPPAARALRLIFMNGPRRGQAVSLRLAPAAVLGRAADCAFAIAEDDQVSLNHARLTADRRWLVVDDLESTNGTWLNGVVIHGRTPVAAGDVLRLGQTELRVEF